MQPDSILHSVESAGIAAAVLPIPSDRSFSTSTASTVANSIHPTTEDTFTGLVVERTVGNLPSPFSNSSETFPGHLPPPPLTAVPIHRRRRFSKSAGMPAIIKRAASTPNVRGLATADVTTMSYDKRRNKLGYHRTSVACGHCRRRKIRCLLAPDDPQGRCSNCIRLKKECNFFPVDQQPPSESSKVPVLKESRNARGQSSSSSPSPSNQQRAAKDNVSNFHPYSPASMPSTQQEFTAPADGGPRTASVPSMSRQPLLLSAPSVRPVLPHMQTVPPLPGAVDYQGPERPAGWDSSPYLDQPPMSNGHRPILQDPSSNFWKLTESPITPAFSSFAGPPGVPAFHHRESVSAFPYAVQREDPGWPLQSRSMSFSHLEGLSMNQSGHYPAANDYKHPPPPPPPPPPHPYPSSYSATHAPPMASLPEPTSAPPDGRTANASFGTAPSWNPSYTGNSIGGMTARSTDSFGGWYQEPARLAQVAEEVSTGPLNEDTPAYYHGTAQSTA